ncbi:MAG: helix-turn-helix transcriptional regulator [Actinobacteria bacterium]|nr:helix-turn-helix transcriptional regulator [Actinomycetota bacterium]
MGVSRIAVERAKKGISQNELAIAIGVSRETIKSWESNANKIPLSRAVAMCDFFCCSIDYLAGRTEDPQGRVFVERSGVSS